MKLVVCLTLLAVASAVSAQGGNQRPTEAQLDAYLRPCVIDGVRCPPNGQLSYAKIMENMNQVKMVTRRLKGQLPSECECDSSAERCNRVCMYAMMKVLIVQYNFPAPIGKRFIGRRN